MRSRRRGVGWRSVAAAVVVGVVGAPVPVAAHGKDRDGGVVVDAREVPMLVSAEPTETPGADVPAGRYGPPARRERPERVRELTEERTATSDTWEYADGSRSVTVSSSPRFFQPVGSQDWQSIDTALVPDEERPGLWRSAANRWAARFGPSGAAGGMQQTEVDGVTVGATMGPATPLGTPLK